MAALSNRRALITGGGSGVGLATAVALVDAGAKVALLGRDAAKLARAADTLMAEDKVVTFPCDVTDPAAVEATIKRAAEAMGGLDILVNNAGANIKARTFAELTPEAWRMMLGANLDGAFYVTRAAMPFLRKDGGIVITINSISGKRANPLGGASYCAAKFGLDGLMAAVGNEERESGVRFSQIYPGEIDTPILEERPSPVSAEHRAKILKPEDVAKIVAFLASQPAHVHIPEVIVKPAWQPYF